MIHRSIVEWLSKNKEDGCTSCGHKRKDHSELENSLGNDGHSCIKHMKRGKATYKCICRRFEEK